MSCSCAADHATSIPGRISWATGAKFWELWIIFDFSETRVESPEDGFWVSGNPHKIAAINIKRDIWKGHQASRSQLENSAKPSGWTPTPPRGATNSPSKATWHFLLESFWVPCSSCDSPNVTPSDPCPSEADMWLHMPCWPCLCKWGQSHSCLPPVTARTWVDLWLTWAGRCFPSWSWPSVILVFVGMNWKVQGPFLPWTQRSRKHWGS